MLYATSREFMIQYGVRGRDGHRLNIFGLLSESFLTKISIWTENG